MHRESNPYPANLDCSRLHKRISYWIRLFAAEINDVVAKSAEQDQTAVMRSLILLYTLRKINSWSRTGS